MLYAFFWVIPRRLKFVFRSFGTLCSETSAYKIQTPENHPKESIQQSTKNIPLGVKMAGAWGWKPHHRHVPNVMEIWESKPPGTLWATSGLLRESFTLFLPQYMAVFLRVRDSALPNIPPLRMYFCFRHYFSTPTHKTEGCIIISQSLPQRVSPWNGNFLRLVFRNSSWSLSEILYRTQVFYTHIIMDAVRWSQ